ncbi:hypothetical protein D3C78_1547890 [compost metagenome]
MLAELGFEGIGVSGCALRNHSQSSRLVELGRDQAGNLAAFLAGQFLADLHHQVLHGQAGDLRDGHDPDRQALDGRSPDEALEVSNIDQSGHCGVAWQGDFIVPGRY